MQDFFTLVSDAHIVAAAMNHFHMPSIESDPPGLFPPTEQNKLHDFMTEIVGGFVDQHVMKFTEVSGMTNPNPSSVQQTECNTLEDHVTNYASLVIGFGLMAANFHDAWREGDGGRLLRCWKFLLLYFRGNGRTKYAVEAFRLIAQTSALLSPRKAHQLIWNRTCNPRGGLGNNIPLDLQTEFLNRVFKEDINTFPSNITSNSVDRSAQSVRQVHDTLEHFDRITLVHKDKGQHVPPDESQDFSLVLQVLKAEDVFTPMPSRAHSCFKNISADPFLNIKKNLPALHKWLLKHRKNAAVEQALMQNKF